MPDFKEVARFLTTGVVATIGNMIVVWLLRGSCSLNLSLAAGLLTGMVISFVMMKTFAFEARDWSGARGEMLRFLIVYAFGTGCYFVAALAAEHGLATLGMAGRLAALGGVVAGGAVMAVTSYFGHRHFTYRRAPAGGEGTHARAADTGAGAGWGRTALVFLVALAVLILVMDPSILLYDEGLILTPAVQTLAGAVVHRDFYFVYGPGAPWVLALLWKLTAYQFLAARLYGAVVIAAIVACADRLMRHLPRTVGWLFTAIVLLSMTGLVSYLYPIFPCILACLIGTALLVAEPARAWNWRPFAAGATAGGALLFRYDAGIAIAAAQGAWILLLDRGAGRERTAAWLPQAVLVRAGLYTAGALAIGLPLLLAALATGTFAAFWHDVVVSGATYYRTHRALPFPGPAELVEHPGLLAIYYPLLALAVAAAVFIWTRKDRQREDRSPAERRTRSLATLTALLTAVLYYKGMVRVQPQHFILSIVPATILLSLCAGRLWPRGRPQRAIVLAGALILAAPTLHGTFAMAAEVAQGRGTMGARLVATATGTGPVPDTLATCAGRPATRFAWLPDAYAVTAGYVRRHSREGEPVFVGLKRHERMLINDVALYFITGRPPGTHWAIFDPGLQTRDDVQAAMIADLTRADVRWIVRNGAYEALHEPNRSDIADGSVRLDRWIAARFRPVGRAGPLAIWLRRDVAVPDDSAAPPACRLDPGGAL